LWEQEVRAAFILKSSLVLDIALLFPVSTVLLMAQGGKESNAEFSPPTGSSLTPNIVSTRLGYSMALHLNNCGAYGRISYRGSISPYTDSMGLEYPVGSRVEHVWGGGLWIGGAVEEFPNQFINVVSTTYESEFNTRPEFYPGSAAADTIWRVNGRNTPKPFGWDAYWGNALPFKPLSDNDLHCMYTDYDFPVGNHTPLGLKVVQSAYAWNDPYADGILIIQYKIINVGTRSINSAFVGIFVDGDVGPISVPSYFTRNHTGYYASTRTAYIHNPAIRGSTPVGVTLLHTSKVLDSLQYTFQWWSASQTPVNDAARYAVMSSAVIRPDEYPALSDTRFLFGFGPFTIRSGSDPHPDTLNVAIALLSGKDLFEMQRNARRALDIYLNQGIRLPFTPPSPPLRLNVGFRRVELDWKWRPGDDFLFGRPDPEENWDSTNQVARRYPSRIAPPYPPGIDSSRGGRNFEAYRIWRSENPNYPVTSFTLMKQVDVPNDSFEYNTGLEYTLVDSNLVRGKTYVYAVTSLSIPNLAEQHIRVGDSTIIVEVPVEPLESSPLVNASRIDLPFTASRESGKVAVVPNPYRTDRNYTLEAGGYEGLTSGWNESARVIKFINLPPKCTLRIFTISGDIVRTVYHDETASSFPRGDANVPLVSESNRALASGVYLFLVESEFGLQTGKFVIIR
jgi:hypothetical protein